MSSETEKSNTATDVLLNSMSELAKDNTWFTVDELKKVYAEMADLYDKSVTKTIDLRLDMRLAVLNLRKTVYNEKMLAEQRREAYRKFHNEVAGDLLLLIWTLAIWLLGVIKTDRTMVIVGAALQLLTGLHWWLSSKCLTWRLQGIDEGEQQHLEKHPEETLWPPTQPSDSEEPKDEAA